MSAGSPPDAADATDSPRKTWTARRVGFLLYLLVLAGGIFIAVAAVPLYVTFDGHFYVQNSWVLFTDSLGEKYWWIREPGYPFFLWLLRAGLGTSDIWVSLAQGAALVGSLALVMAAVWRRANIWLIVVATAIAVFNPLYMTYSGRILQQALLVVGVAALSFVCAMAWRQGKVRAYWIAVGTAVLTAAGSAIAVQLGAAALASSLVVAAGLLRPSATADSAGDRGVWKRIAAPLLAICLSVAAFAGVMYGWAAVKESAEVPEVVAGGGPPNRSATDLVPADLFDPSVRLARANLALWPLLSLTGRDYIDRPDVYENRIYANVAMAPGSRCGMIEGRPPSVDPQALAETLSPSCRAEVPHALYGQFVRFGKYAMALSAISLLIGIGLSLVLRDWRVLAMAMPAVFFIGTYATIGLGLDRYGLPYYPIGMAMFAYIGSRVLNLFGKLRTASSEETDVSEADRVKPPEDQSESESLKSG